MNFWTTDSIAVLCIPLDCRIRTAGRCTAPQTADGRHSRHIATVTIFIQQKRIRKCGSLCKTFSEYSQRERDQYHPPQTSVQGMKNVFLLLPYVFVRLQNTVNCHCWTLTWICSLQHEQRHSHVRKLARKLDRQNKWTVTTMSKTFSDTESLGLKIHTQFIEYGHSSDQAYIHVNMVQLLSLTVYTTILVYTNLTLPYKQNTFQTNLY